MSFISAPFVMLVAVVIAVQAALRTVRAQNLWVLGASLVFYGWTHPLLVGLLLASALLDYACGLELEARPQRRRAVIAASVVGNLGVLLLFKLQDWFVQPAALALEAIGLPASHEVLALGMPLGLSFFTFQTLGYTLDVASGRLRARRDVVDYLLFVCFFPQLVSGPIEQGSDLLPQLEQRRTLDPTRLARGLSLAAWGAFKKVCVADAVATHVDVMLLAADPGPGMVLVGGVGFGVQLYADFSGYTDMARGVAHALGVRLSHNFDRPFLALSTPDFWRRWHITLTRWVGDHVFTPLARGGTAGPLRLAGALVATYVVIGLWHGLEVRFLVFGLVHAASALVATFAGPLLPRGWSGSRVARAAAIALHTLVVLIPTGILFRDSSLLRAREHLGALLGNQSGLQADAALATAGPLAVALVVLIFGAWIGPRAQVALARSRWGLVGHGAWWAVAAVLVLAMAGDRAPDFLYFRF
ncbi:MAG: MBOAT family protein [Alphaproteobacteria bacterium]|nr:MBOAT family protein [Alphaproteobacteria bacterium]